MTRHPQNTSCRLDSGQKAITHQKNKKNRILNISLSLVSYDVGMTFWTQKETPTLGVSTPPQQEFQKKQLVEREHAIRALGHLYLQNNLSPQCETDQKLYDYLSNPDKAKTPLIDEHFKEIEKPISFKKESDSHDRAAYSKDLLNQLIQAHADFLKDQGLIQELKFTPEDDYLGSLKKLRTPLIEKDSSDEASIPNNLKGLQEALNNLPLDSTDTRPDWESIQQTMAALSLTTLHQREVCRWKQRAEQAKKDLERLTPTNVREDISSKIENLKGQSNTLREQLTRLPSNRYSATTPQILRHKIQKMENQIASLETSQDYLSRKFGDDNQETIPPDVLDNDSPYIQHLKTDLKRLQKKKEQSESNIARLNKTPPADYAVGLANDELAKETGSNVKTSVKSPRNLMRAETLVTDDAERQERQKKQESLQKEKIILEQIGTFAASQNLSHSPIDIYTPFPGAPNNEHLNQLETLFNDFYSDHNGVVSKESESLTLTHTVSANEKADAPKSAFKTVTKYNYNTGQIESTISDTNQRPSTQDQLAANIFATYAYAYPNEPLPSELNLDIAATFTQLESGNILEQALQKGLAKLVPQGDTKTFTITINQYDKWELEVTGSKSRATVLDSTTSPEATIGVHDTRDDQNAHGIEASAGERSMSVSAGNRP